MSFKQLHTALCRLGSVARPLGLVVLVGALLGVPPAVRAQQVEEPGADTTRRFYQDDPWWIDPDTNDVPPVSEFELFEDYDFVQNSFGHPGGPAGPSHNINTLDEVPDFKLVYQSHREREDGSIRVSQRYLGAFQGFSWVI